MTLVPPRRPCEGPEGRLCYVRCPECREMDKESTMNAILNEMEEYRRLEDELEKLLIKVADLNVQIADIRNQKGKIRLRWMRMLDGVEE